MPNDNAHGGTHPKENGRTFDPEPLLARARAMKPLPMPPPKTVRTEPEPGGPGGDKNGKGG
jgi:hypothetical protein